MDHNEFFRTATLKICGDLALEKALHTTLLYLRRHMPADALFAEYFDPALGAARTIARADAAGGIRLDRILPVPSKARNDRDFKSSAILGHAVVLNHPEENAIASTMLSFHRYDPSSTSIITMQLVGEDDMFGGLVVLAEHRDAFTEEHGELLTMLAEPFKVAMVNALQHRDLERHKERLADDNRHLQRELQRITGEEIVGADFGLRDLMQLVRQVAPTESPVLLSGETGTGKDVIAGAIHRNSARSSGPFIPVNCGAIPPSLIDSELFGHEKGAFTGALTRRRGRFERADGGTIFLDEIGEMPLDAQVRLLRVIQHREVERLGGPDRIPVDIRIIAATNRDLASMVEAGRFREDLWFRLNVFPIAVPPLRERRQDIPALVQHFIDRKARELKTQRPPSLANGAIEGLMDYDWPGNVRELENIIERAMILCRNEPLRFDDLGLSRSNRKVTRAVASPEVAELDTVIRAHIELALRTTNGKIHGPGGAAELLAINPNTLRYKMKKLGIPFRKGSKPPTPARP